MSRAIFTILLGLTPIVLLLSNIEARTAERDFRSLSGDWTRAWDDVAIGSGLASQRAFPVAPYLVTNSFSRKGQVAFDSFKETFSSLEETHGTSLSRPWETFPAAELFPRRPRVAQRFDDWGRAYLLGWGFRMTGGVAPGMLFWLAPAFACLVLFWIVVEAVRAGLPLFGMGTSVLVAISAFCGDMLILGYSATGFYVVSILVCLAYGLGVMGRAVTVSSLIARSLAAGAFMGLAVNCRSVSVLVLPAFLVIALVGAKRLDRPGWRRAAAVVASVVVLTSPALLLRAHLADSARRAAEQFGGDIVPGSHDIWITYWQGLGDFDRSHGHVFLDQAGLAALHEHGGHERVSERSEAIMRRLVIESIQSEPGWFAGILVRRAAGTLSFHKLWPMASKDSPGFYPSTAPNEGVTDSYWAMASQADTFRLGSRKIEAPAILLPITLASFFLAAGRPFGRVRDDRRTPMVKIVGALVLATLLAPVATTTAGAFEPESLVLAVFAAMAGLLQIGWWNSWPLLRGARPLPGRTAATS